MGASPTGPNLSTALEAKGDSKKVAFPLRGYRHAKQHLNFLACAAWHLSRLAHLGSLRLAIGWVWTSACWRNFLDSYGSSTCMANSGGKTRDCEWILALTVCPWGLRSVLGRGKDQNVDSDAVIATNDTTMKCVMGTEQEKNKCDLAKLEGMVEQLILSWQREAVVCSSISMACPKIDRTDHDSFCAHVLVHKHQYRFAPWIGFFAADTTDGHLQQCMVQVHLQDYRPPNLAAVWAHIPSSIVAGLQSLAPPPACVVLQTGGHWRGMV